MAAAYASSSSTSRYTYDVFLSFRGEDTRKNFTDHLYAALVQAGFQTFRDDDEIQRGEKIDLEIQRGIQESKLSIIVFSRDYASSRWCLDELVMILKHKQLGELLHVLPVFSDVDPTQVRKQTGSYAAAFVKHEERFDKGRVEEWRAALRQVAGLAGMVLGDRHEYQFIQAIIKEVGSKVSRMVLHVDPYLVGVDYSVEHINLWLQEGENHVAKLATISGLGGIGKTTVAKIVYNMNLNKFEVCSFLSNVREKAKQPTVLVQLQRKFLSDLLKMKVEKIQSVEEGIIRIERALYRKKILLIMDDVDQPDQFDAIISMKKCCYQGSKIIVTTRYENLLKTHEVDKKFKIKELDRDKSLELFSWHAFHKDHPEHGYKMHSERVVYLCGGLPLALKVLGSSLFGNSAEEWESALKKLGKVANGEIQKVLRISYDSLLDRHDKSLFLHIACFFIGMNKGYVVRILDGCNFDKMIGIKNLVDRGLLTIDGRNELMMMHQLIRDMGREIVLEESYDNPGERSRVWGKDAFDVLSQNTGTKSIRGLNLDMSMLMQDKYLSTLTITRCGKRSRDRYSIDELLVPHGGKFSKRRILSFFSWEPVNSAAPLNLFSTKAFSEMRELKLLKLSSVEFSGSYKDFPKSLVWLRWDECPLNSIPNDLCLEKLVVLDMRNSNLQNVWRGIKFLKELKILNLSHSHNLFRTPNLKGLPNLERLVFKDCVSLNEIDESIGELQRLVSLNLDGCKNLKKLPVQLNMLKSLEELLLSGCVNLVEFPKDLRKLESLKVLNASGIAKNLVLSERPSFWHSITSWLLHRRCAESINFSLAFFPSSLVRLNLASCDVSDDAILKDLSCCLPSLVELNLSGNPISCIPESIRNLNRLEELHLDRCRRLQSLPELPRNLNMLSLMYCTSLERVTNAPCSWITSTRTIVPIHNCKKLVQIPGIYKLEAIADTNPEILYNLSLENVESLQSREVQLYNHSAGTEMNTINRQVLHEDGIVSIFLPGREVPDWFGIKVKGLSKSFDVPPVVGHKICGFSLCVAYPCTIQFMSACHNVEVKNITKGLMWRYAPRIRAAERNTDMLWFSQWIFADNNLLEESDQVEVLVRMHGLNTFDINEFGIHLIYEPEGSVTRLLNHKILLHSRPVPSG